MKHTLILILISLVVFSCSKDKVPAPIENSYYESNGNLLILEIDEDLESIYEYNLTSTDLNNDSLPLYYETYSGLYFHSYLKFTPNPDTLFEQSSNNYTFFTPKIDVNELQNSSNSIPFDSTQFQLIESQNNFDYSSIWSKISNLEIVRTYRNSNPTSKIGITRIVSNVYDEQLGFGIPTEKHLIFLVK